MTMQEQKIPNPVNESQMMWAVVQDQPGYENLKVKRIPIPQPKSGQVLIRVEAAPINPSDLYMMMSTQLSFPFIPGNQGSGIVVKSGGGLLARALVKNRVAFTRKPPRPGGPLGSLDGTYAQYCVANAKTVITISDKKVQMDHACCFFVNPATAIGLLERLKELKAKTVLMTAAASQLGKMLIRLAPQYGVRFISTVRRQEQADMLREELKQEQILVEDEKEKFWIDMKQIIKQQNVRHCIECIAGDMTGKILNLMPDQSTMIVYGSLSLQKIRDIDPRRLIYNGHKIQGFILTKWILAKNLLKRYLVIRKINKMLGGVLSSEVSKRFGLHQIREAIEYYQSNMTAGKVIMKGSLIPEGYSAE